MPKARSRVLITGDVVLDCHLYGGVKAAATSSREPGTVYRQHLGGAALTHRLIAAGADAKGLAWDAARKIWTDENKQRKRNDKKPLPWPADLPKKRPSRIFDARLDIETDGLTDSLPGHQDSLPGHLCSYGIWREQPVREGAEERVWRADQRLGYGPTGPTPAKLFRRRTSASPRSASLLTVIDDGGILFRHKASRAAWPAFRANKNGFYLLKMAAPICRSDLWPRLARVMDRLIVVVSAPDIRREDVQISRRLSWEQTIEHAIRAVQDDPWLSGLLRARHLIVNFRSAGALWIRRDPDDTRVATLLFDPVRLEGDYARQFKGTTYGFQTCLAAAIAVRLMQWHVDPPKDDDKKLLPSPFASPDSMARALQEGVATGLVARRHLLELGHRAVGHPEPGFPVPEIAQVIAKPSGGFVTVNVPLGIGHDAGRWTIVGQGEHADDTGAPLVGLALLTARYGRSALSPVPAFRLGPLFSIDRSEIESLRTLEGLLRTYEERPTQKKPLSIGVFGPPGAGKSFGVKALAQAILGEKVPFLEFNLSQFNGPDDLIGAFHRVRDAVLRGVTPVAFWDEFDSQEYRWLQYLLAPMQDGAFQEGQITHPIGKCVFVFAGGTSHTYEAFGVPEPPQPPEDLAQLPPDERLFQLRELKEQQERRRRFTLLKGPDFISRLDGFLNVLGPNGRPNAPIPDITWPIRRALALRSLLGLGDGDVLDADPGLLYALLMAPRYEHGMRSFEKVVRALDRRPRELRLQRSALPPAPALNCETDAATIHRLMAQRSPFRALSDIESLAAAVHQSFLGSAQKAALEAKIRRAPSRKWVIHPAVEKEYADLPEDKKASNRAAAQRIPDHLSLIGFAVESQQKGDDEQWHRTLAAVIERHLERLAQAEHLGWCEERIGNGWRYAATRNDRLKHHHLLVEWAQLTLLEQDKDRAAVRAIPDLLKNAGYKAERIRSGDAARADGGACGRGQRGDGSRQGATGSGSSSVRPAGRRRQRPQPAGSSRRPPRARTRRPRARKRGE